jgi:hypothetical protein
VTNQIARPPRTRSSTAGIIRKGWWALATVLLLLIGLALTSLTTEALELTIAGLSENYGVAEGRQLVSRQLAVPFEPQGQTRWCYEASLSMVLRYFGKQVSPQDVAEGLGVGEDGSTSFFHIYGGGLKNYLAQWPDLSVRQHVGNWDFNAYVGLLDAGSPVVVSTFGLPGHTVVVTGYAETDGEKYLYINDPSGYYTRMEWGTGRTRQALVGWSQFSRNIWSELVITGDK